MRQRPEEYHEVVGAVYGIRVFWSRKWSRRFYVIKYYYMDKKDLMIWATIRKLYYKALINTSWT